ncbi:MAG: DUF1080 domain-containing protein [bacterium]|nr:DUF1080 domain-containing protein [bacterium]
MRKWIGILAIVAVAAAPMAWAAEGSATDKAPKKIKLFNGKNLDGWKLFVPDENVDTSKVWMVKDGVVHCTGKPSGYMRTTKKYRDYKLTWEWRWVDEGSNSGCLIHVQDKDEIWPKAIEYQLMHKNAADIWNIGGTTFKEHKNKDERRVPKMKKSNEKPLGEWNKGLIISDGDDIKMYVNGELQNQATDATVSEGYIAYQSEGAPIEFRKIVLAPLKKADEGSEEEGS